MRRAWRSHPPTCSLSTPRSETGKCRCSVPPRRDLASASAKHVSQPQRGHSTSVRIGYTTAARPLPRSVRNIKGSGTLCARSNLRVRWCGTRLDVILPHARPRDASGARPPLLTWRWPAALDDDALERGERDRSHWTRIKVWRRTRPAPFRRRRLSVGGKKRLRNARREGVRT